jgi:hypothetical protein
MSTPLLNYSRKVVAHVEIDGLALYNVRGAKALTLFVQAQVSKETEYGN